MVSSAAEEEPGPIQVDATYSEVPVCNAFVRHIAEEVVPCIQQVEPEIAEQLQTLIKTYQNRTRVRPDLLDEQNVIDQVEETCQVYWKSVLHQLESSGPVGECRMLAK